jgi:hypothetical protein
MFCSAAYPLSIKSLTQRPAGSAGELKRKTVASDGRTDGRSEFIYKIPLFKYYNVVALSFKANAFEVREMGVLML